MPVYSAHKSILIVEPINVSDDDMSLLSMEKDPFDILAYFISTNDNSPRFKSRIYEDFLINFEFDAKTNQDIKNDKTICRVWNNKFLFINLVKNTAWIKQQTGWSKDFTKRIINRKFINTIKSVNNKHTLVIPDAKFYNYINGSSQKMTKPPRVNLNRGASNKILDIILSGVLGGKGSRITPNTLYQEVKKVHPDISLQAIKGACNTLVSHGDLAKVPVLDFNGNHKFKVDKNGCSVGAFAYGKYTINVVTKSDLNSVPANNNPVPVPVSSAPVSAPANPVSVASVSTTISSNSKIDKLAKALLEQGVSFKTIAEIIGS